MFWNIQRLRTYNVKDLIFVHMFQKRLNIRNKFAEKSVLSLVFLCLG